MSDAQRCEPGEGWRDRKGFHWVKLLDGAQICAPWYPAAGAHAGIWRWMALVRAEDAHQKGWSYLEPAAPPDLVRALVEALDDLLALPVAQDELRILDRGIGTATKNAAWLRARAALQCAKEAGV